MNRIEIALFGRPQVRLNGTEVPLCNSRKALELLFFLLLNGSRPQSREIVASRLWPHHTTSQSRAYLRRSILQLLRWYTDMVDDRVPVLLRDADSVRVNPAARLKVDIELVAQAFRAVRDQEGRALDEETAALVVNAIKSFRGALLESWYDDWLPPFRDALNQKFLVLVDKLMDYKEDAERFEAALEFGERALRVDAAREETHVRIMRVLYKSGKRCDALRQYERCKEVLRSELDVEPSEVVLELYGVIAGGNGAVHVNGSLNDKKSDQSGEASHSLASIEHLRVELSTFVAEADRRLRVIEESLRNTG